MRDFGLRVNVMGHLRGLLVVKAPDLEVGVDVVFKD